ncbi:MAG: hypothetical protein JWN30_201 [Bacilli bacterium]|nr:hypothetical protein [Bacilli bacterium]
MSKQEQTVEGIAHDEVKLSDSRVVKLRETIGNDEMIVASQLGDIFEPNMAGQVIFNSCLMVRTIVSIDGKPVESMRKYEEVRDFLASFKGKDWKKIAAKYKQLNEDEGND